MYFMQAFQGSIIIRTNDYLQRDPVFLPEEQDSAYVMLF